MATYRANFKRRDGGDERRNSLGLDSDRLNRLLDLLDNRSQDASLKRTHVRWPFRHESVMFRLIEGLGSHREFKVAARNLSNSGLSVIHNSYVHPGMECEVRLPMRSDGMDDSKTVGGTVRRCQHVQGVVHEIGVEFAEPIDARQFLSQDSMPAYYSLETIDVEKMEGTVLHVEDSALDRRLFAHYLADTRVIIKAAESIEDAKAKLSESFDLIILDINLPDGRGIDLVNWLRESGILTPVIVVTADHSHTTQCELARAEISGYLTKPIEQGTLQRAVSEYLRVADAQSSAADGSMRELVSAFMAELGKTIDELRVCQQNDDAMTAYSIALRMKGTAPSLGFDQLANVCDRAVSALAGSMSISESQRQLDALIDACERLKHRRAG